ncbi:MBL fold metallo-hydrolase [Candidatus Latescibacterota bacterium]
MKRISALLVISLSIFLISLSSSFAQQAAAPVTLNNVAGNIYEIRGGRGANGGAYIGEDGVLLIEAKQDSASVAQVLAGIRKLTRNPIVYVVSTHSDGDHVFGNRFFPASVTFISHENCRAEFFVPNSRGEPSDWNDPALAPFLPEITYRDKMDIYVGAKRIELWHFGVGHTTGDTVVYFPEEKVAFIGDQIFMTRPQLIHAYKGGNSFEHVATLTRMLETLDAQQFCSGHSDIVDRQTIMDHIKEMRAMQARVQSLMKKNMTLEAIQKEFAEDEARLVGVIYDELND